MIAKPAGEHTWGGRAYRRRVQLGLTQAQVSKLSGLTQQAISKIERGDATPRWETLFVLAKAYGTTVPELFPQELIPREASKSALKARRDKVEAIKAKRKAA